MKILKFHYHMEIRFDLSVKEHHFSGHGQLVESINYQVFPNRYISRSSDSFSNECIYGYCEEEHDHFMVDVEGIVRTGMEESAAGRMENSNSIFRYQTKHTMPGPVMHRYHDEIEKEFCQVEDIESRKTSEKKALFYMHRLHQDFTYESGTTKIETTAEDALQMGHGVCQDFTHILLGLLRMEQIPCRYVTGMMEGEGFSHAWAEVYTEEGWIALDPTNDLEVTDGHISISRGRDYKDCMLNQGIFTGCKGKAGQEQQVKVEVTEIG